VSAITAKLQAVAEGLARVPRVTGWVVLVDNAAVSAGVELPLPAHAVSAKSVPASAARIEYTHFFFITSMFVALRISKF
jgi:hypothetical protein